MTTFSNIKKRYEELKAERDKYVPRWEEVSKYVGIRVKPQDNYAKDNAHKGEDLDKYTEDPTASLSVQQSADYIKGIMWGNGNDVITLEPSDDLLQMVTAEAVNPWFEYATSQLLRQMNHPNAGLNTALGSYCYDQQAFGTSGVGAFVNSGYKSGVDNNLLLFRPYGIDTLCIDEGKNGLPEVVFNTTQWRVNRLISEFCERDGVFDDEAFAKMPQKVQEAWRNNNLNILFTITHAVLPREDYTPGALGKRGCKYVGYWFEETSKEPFFEEDYKEMPIPVARAIKIRGEVYGRASGTMLISTIRCINQAVSDCMVTMAKMVKPPIGVLSSALFGDDVIDTSENGLTVFNAAQLNGQNPIIPMQDVGDPSSIVNWLVPYLNEKVATAFKIDILLDFAQNSNMTATESLQRYSIRGKSIAGMILQQKMELFEPLIRRCVSICMDYGVLGIDPTDGETIVRLEALGRNDMIIPDAVVECIRENKPWFKIKFNNEVDKIGKTDRVDDLLKMLNFVTALMSVYPDIAMAIDWYGLLKDASEAMNLEHNVVSLNKFKKEIADKAQQQAQLMQAQTGQLQAQANRDNATALKDITNEQ